VIEEHGSRLRQSVAVRVAQQGVSWLPPFAAAPPRAFTLPWMKSLGLKGTLAGPFLSTTRMSPFDA